MILVLRYLQAGLKSLTWVAVTIKDENDHSPVWEQPTYSGYILETATEDDPVLRSTDDFTQGSGISNKHSSIFNQRSSADHKSPSDRFYSNESHFGPRADNYGGEIHPARGPSGRHYGGNISSGSDNSRDYIQGVIHPTEESFILAEPLTLTALDEDVGMNGRVVYDVASRSTAASYFKIDSFTGMYSTQD